MRFVATLGRPPATLGRPPMLGRPPATLRRASASGEVVRRLRGAAAGSRGTAAGLPEQEFPILCRGVGVYRRNWWMHTTICCNRWGRTEPRFFDAQRPRQSGAV